MPRPTAWRSLVLLILSCLLLTPALPAQDAPKTGRDVLERMNRAYKDVWYRNLTFVQTTTINRGKGPTEQTWYETVASPGILRIDVADPDSGNGVLYTRDSVIVVRGGKVARRVGGGNPFLPLIQGVYVQPVDETVKDLAAYRIDLTATMTRGSGDSLTWVVGTRTAGDTLSPQFWVEAKRLVVTRIIADAAPNLRMDAVLDGYVPVGKAWLATHVMISLPDGRQGETYKEWKANRTLPAGFFDPARWMEGKHWAKEGQ